MHALKSELARLGETSDRFEVDETPKATVLFGERSNPDYACTFEPRSETLWEKSSYVITGDDVHDRLPKVRLHFG